MTEGRRRLLPGGPSGKQRQQDSARWSSPQRWHFLTGMPGVSSLRSIPSMAGSPRWGCGGWLGAGLGLVPVGEQFGSALRSAGWRGCPTRAEGVGCRGAGHAAPAARDERIEARRSPSREQARVQEERRLTREFQAPQIGAPDAANRNGCAGLARREPRCGHIRRGRFRVLIVQPGRALASSRSRRSCGLPCRPRSRPRIWPCPRRSAAPRSGAAQRWGDGAPGAR